MTTQVLADALAPLAADLARILAEKADLEQAEREIKAKIRKLVPGPDTYQAGTTAIVVSANRRFDPHLAEQVVPPELLNLCRLSKVDSAVAKTVLPPALYTACMAEVGDYRIGFAR